MSFLFTGSGKRLLRAVGMTILPVILLLSGFVVNVPLSQAASQQTTVYSGATTGTIAPFGQAVLQGVQPTAAPSSARFHTRTNRSLPGRATASSATPASGGGQGQRRGQLLANFNGVSSLDSEVTNFGAEFEPPDQGLCVGNGFVIDAVNSAFTIYTTHGKPWLAL